MIKIERNCFTELPDGFVVTDRNIRNHYGDLLNGHRHCILDPGEQSKTGESYLRIAEELEGEDTITAFGGGVVGDLAGFVAATYKRGIRLIQVPTSLMAMVDSSIGGKNGINVGNRKNHLGTIYQPGDILMDLRFLDTLPIEEFRNGVAEIIKYAFVFDVDRLKRKIEPTEDLRDVILTCCCLKTKVVEKDEKDKGCRHILNFGHTVGHAIELLYGLRHGEAISIGMVKEMRWAERHGIVEAGRTEQLIFVLKENGLPTNMKFDRMSEVVELMKADKKNKNGKIMLAIDEDNWNVEVEDIKSLI